MTIDFNDAPRQSSPFEDAEARKVRVGRILQGRIRDLVRYLYPHAVLTASDARIGDASGSKGASMAIALAPADKAGMWIDHATGEKGDVFTLYARAHNLDPHRDFATVLTECDAWAGGQPAARAVIRNHIETAKPAEPPPTKEWERTYTYRSKDGKTILAEVKRYRTSDGKKTFVPFIDDRPGMALRDRPLYGLERWHANSPVVLVEGEKCADALLMLGIDATTAMGGANTTIEKTDWTPLAGKTVIMWPDADAPGLALMERLRGPLQALGCVVRMLTLPANKTDGWDAADAIAEGFDVVGFLAEPTTKAKTLPILDVPGLLSVPDPTWIIDGWVIDDGVSVFYGPAKTFKTFNVLDMALSVACGVPWRGNAVVQQPVLYLLGEGMGTFKYRVHVWLQKRSEGRQARFWTVPVGVPLGSPEGLQAALDAIASLPVMPGLIVIDTLNRHFGPGDENSTQDMTKFVQAIDAIRAATRAHICIVHHSGKDTEKGSRGSSALLGAVDNEFRITRTEGTKLCRIECTAARHSDEPKPMTVELVKFEAVNPVTGEVMSSLLPVLRSTDEDTDNPLAGLPEKAQAVLEALQDGAKTLNELADELGLTRGRLSMFVPQMEKRGVISSFMDGKAKRYHVLVRHPSTRTEDKTDA